MQVGRLQVGRLGASALIALDRSYSYRASSRDENIPSRSAQGPPAETRRLPCVRSAAVALRQDTSCAVALRRSRRDMAYVGPVVRGMVRSAAAHGPVWVALRQDTSCVGGSARSAAVVLRQDTSCAVTLRRSPVGGRSGWPKRSALTRHAAVSARE